MTVEKISLQFLHCNAVTTVSAFHRNNPNRSKRNISRLRRSYCIKKREQLSNAHMNGAQMVYEFANGWKLVRISFRMQCSHELFSIDTHLIDDNNDYQV